uniref:thioesterase II family protein n=1 Tax=Paenibacillus caui TaxID=2873927 RepID=UPI001CA84F86
EGVSLGYLNRPELTAEKFVPSPFDPNITLYRTGDLARQAADGTIEYMGRADKQVKIRGYRVELAEVEHALLQLPDIEQVVVQDLEHQGSAFLCAYIVADGVLSIPQVRGYLTELLPAYMVPTYYVQVNEIPITANGKIDRKALPIPDTGLFSIEEYTEPQTDMEQLLAEIWKTVLGVPRIGRSDRFFDLGGDSIKVIQVSSRLYQAGYTVEIKHLFRNVTISQLSKHVRAVCQIAGEEKVHGTVLPNSIVEHGKTSPSFMKLNEPTSTKLRLFCFPYAGGGSSVYLPWASLLGDQIKLLAIQLPGRESRIFEQPYNSLDEVIGTLVREIHPYLDKPFVFFGHSMGALIGFELIRAIYQQYKIQPEHLFVSSFRAPHLPKTSEKIYHLNDNDFLERICNEGNLPEEVIKNNEFIRLLLPMLRNDFKMAQTYEYVNGIPFNCPITAFVGEEDTVNIREIQEWQQHTQSAFRIHMLPGNHFHFISNFKEIINIILKSTFQPENIG